MTKVTIGLPFFNPGERFLDALKSIYAQTHEDWELLLVDDGSTDRSGTIASSLKDNRVRYLRDNTNRGLPARLNQIAREAKGDILVRMDADDMMHPQRLELLIQSLRDNQKAHVVHSASISLDTQNKPIGRSRSRISHPTENEVFRTGGILHSTIAAPKAWFLSNPYEESYIRAEDRELFVRTYRETKYAYIDRPLYYYFHVGNVRPKAYARTYKTERRVLRKYGPSRLGILETWKLIFRSHLKSALLLASSAVGVQNRIFRHQPTSLSDTEVSDYYSALERIQKQTLPLSNEAS